MPLITIITSTLNCKADFKKTADSIRTQLGEKPQWIVIDGKSTDGTIDSICENHDLIGYWVTESDCGIYDAWNKALPHINGEWTLFLGAGDQLAGPTTTVTLSKELSKMPPDVVLAYGKVLMIHNEFPRYETAQKDLSRYEFGRPSLPNHQGVLHRSRIFQDLRFDHTLRIAADSKLLLQALRMGKIQFIDHQVSRMNDSGISNDHRQTFQTQREINQICRELSIRQPSIEMLKAYSLRVANYAANKFLPRTLIRQARKILDAARRS